MRRLLGRKKKNPKSKHSNNDDNSNIPEDLMSGASSIKSGQIDDGDLDAELRSIAQSEGISLEELGINSESVMAKPSKMKHDELLGADLDAISKIGKIDHEVSFKDEDLNDPVLQAELKSLGVSVDFDKGRSQMKKNPKDKSTAAVLAELGLGDLGAVENVELTEEDFNDPDLQEQMAGLKSETDSEEEESTTYANDAASLRAKAEEKKRAAVAAKKAGNVQEAVALLRESKAFEREAQMAGNLGAAQAIAKTGKVVSRPVTHAKAETSPVDSRKVSPRINTQSAAPATPKLAKLNSRDRVEAEIATLKQNALKLKQDGNTQGALEIMRKIKQLQAVQSGTLFKRASSRAVASPRMDAFAGFENAVTEAYNMYLNRAKELRNVDKQSAAAEAKKMKAMKGHLDMIKQYRAAGGSPPESRWEIVIHNRAKRREDIRPEEIEVSVLKVTSQVPGQTGRNIFVKYSLSKDSTSDLVSSQTKDKTFRGEDLEIDDRQKFPFHRNARSSILAISKRRATFEVWQKKKLGFFAPEFLGKASVEMNPLLTKCELNASLPLHADGSRRAVGGAVEVQISLNRSLQVEEVVETKERDFIVGEWPPLQVSGKSTPSQSHSPANSSPPPNASIGTQPQAEAKSTQPMIGPSPEEMADPFSPNLLLSNDVLDAEIESLKQKFAGREMDTDALVRLTQLETNLGNLVASVQSGALTLEEYIDRLKVRVQQDKRLAAALSRQNKKSDAVAVLKRSKIMEAEIAGASETEDV